jgi:hypothetical protein
LRLRYSLDKNRHIATSSSIIFNALIPEEEMCLLETMGLTVLAFDGREVDWAGSGGNVVVRIPSGSHRVTVNIPRSGSYENSGPVELSADFGAAHWYYINGETRIPW